MRRCSSVPVASSCRLPKPGRASWLLLLVLAWASAMPPVRALSFNLVCAADPTCASLNANAYAGFQAAAARWSNLLFDPITVKLQIGFSALGAGILGQAGTAQNVVTYGGFRNALGLDRLSADDNQAYGSLPAGNSFNLLINRTTNNAGSATPYLDVFTNDANGFNNYYLTIATANVKALGGSPGYGSDLSQLDGVIGFSSSYSWDFDPSNGITPGTIDFVAVATHEIGHTLGFFSGVDELEASAPAAESVLYNVSSLDLFRFSALSSSLGVIDWTADTRAKYFSLDGGLTSLAQFSTGVTYGDGRQASHWKDNLSLGLMDPTLGYGELGVISALDLRAFDVIGYDTSVRAPAPLPLLGSASALLWRRRLRQRQAAGVRLS